MELVIPCNSCASLIGKPAFNRNITPSRSNIYRFHPPKCRGRTTSELQTPVEATDRAGSYSSSIPIHKVTVHDRQRGVVHEFVVPEGLRWYAKRLRIDEDGDVANEFLDEVLPPTPTNTENQRKLPRFEVKTT